MACVASSVALPRRPIDRSLNSFSYRRGGRSAFASTSFLCRYRLSSIVLEAGELRESHMQYAILCYHDEKVTCAWSKEHDDAVMAKLGVVREKLERQGKLGPVARLL